jgi:hypothetical protein
MYYGSKKYDQADAVSKRKSQRKNSQAFYAGKITVDG